MHSVCRVFALFHNTSCFSFQFGFFPHGGNRGTTGPASVPQPLPDFRTPNAQDANGYLLLRGLILRYSSSLTYLPCFHFFTVLHCMLNVRSAVEWFPSLLLHECRSQPAPLSCAIRLVDGCNAKSAASPRPALMRFKPSMG